MARGAALSEMVVVYDCGACLDESGTVVYGSGTAERQTMYKDMTRDQ
jgi:hypothetical protein